MDTIIGFLFVTATVGGAVRWLRFIILCAVHLYMHSSVCSRPVYALFQLVELFIFRAHRLRYMSYVKFLKAEITKNVQMELTCSIHDGKKYIRNALKNIMKNMAII